MKAIYRFTRACIAIFILAAAITACDRNNKFPKPEFPDLTGSLIVENQVVMEYNELKQQIRINPDKGEYSQFNDDYSEYFTVVFNHFPTEEGEVVKADLNWKTAKETKELKNLSFKTINFDSKGETILWDSSKGICLFLRKLPE